MPSPVCYTPFYKSKPLLLFFLLFIIFYSQLLYGDRTSKILRVGIRTQSLTLITSFNFFIALYNKYGNTPQFLTLNFPFFSQSLLLCLKNPLEWSQRLESYRNHTHF